MRDNFAVFILTHGRADNVVTMAALKKGHYTGRWYMIVDNEDDQRSKYISNYGEEHVITFDKQVAYEACDTMDNFNNHIAIVYARNVSWEIAQKLGLDYFLMLDDDYSNIDYRWAEKGKLKAKPILNYDEVFEAMLNFLDVSNADTVAFAQGGDLIGGVEGSNFKKKLLRKAMNSFFCKVSRPIQFKGTMNEDVVTYTTQSSRGRLFFSHCAICVCQLPTQSLKGGMTNEYLKTGTYVKSFYAVMSMPSAVKIGVMGTSHKRIHHQVEWDKVAPKILNERWRISEDEHFE